MPREARLLPEPDGRTVERAGGGVELEPRRPRRPCLRVWSSSSSSCVLADECRRRRPLATRTAVVSGHARRRGRMLMSQAPARAPPADDTRRLHNSAAFWPTASVSTMETTAARNT